MMRLLSSAFKCIILYACTWLIMASGFSQYRVPKEYKPDDLELYQTILHLDSVFFDAYNHCSEKLELYASFYADSIEFYHDRGGLMRSKAAIVEATRINICGKVTRELVTGSVEVCPIQGYGAVEIGWHYFHNNQEPAPAQPVPGRFVVVWRNTSDGWRITRVISLH